MATTTFTNATDYGPDDNINSAVNVTGMTVADVTNVRLEIDWNPNGSDPSCGGDAASSSCQVTDPGGGVTVVFNSYDKSGTSARTDTHDITSGFPSSFNGNWTFTLEDEDAMGCNTVTETRIIVTYTSARSKTMFLGAEAFGDTPPAARSKTMFLGAEAFGDTPPPARSKTMFLGVEILGSGGSTPDPDPPSAAGLVKAGNATVIAVYAGDQPLQSIHAGDVEIKI